ncbi:MAG: hypothetical protein ABIS59_01555 [Candidatus Saccharibacteria bacterium]
MKVVTGKPGAAGLLWGTTAPPIFGDLYYGGLRKAIDGFHVPLPDLGLKCLFQTAKAVEDHLEILRDENGMLKLIGHSQGGLIAVIHAASHPNTKVLTIGTPHRGSRVADLTCLLPRRVREKVQAFDDMRPGSEFMQDYQPLLDSVAGSVVSLAATHDKIVHHRSSYIHGASRNVLVVSSYDEYKKYFKLYGEAVDLRFEPKLGHITWVVKGLCKNFVREFCDTEPLRLASA